MIKNKLKKSLLLHLVFYVLLFQPMAFNSHLGCESPGLVPDLFVGAKPNGLGTWPNFNFTNMQVFLVVGRQGSQAREYTKS